VGAGGGYAERERLPPLLEARVLDVDGENTLFDLAKPGFSEELREVACTGARELLLILGVRIELTRRLPKHA